MRETSLERALAVDVPLGRVKVAADAGQALNTSAACLAGVLPPQGVLLILRGAPGRRVYPEETTTARFRT